MASSCMLEDYFTNPNIVCEMQNFITLLVHTLPIFIVTFVVLLQS